MILLQICVESSFVVKKLLLLYNKPCYISFLFALGQWGLSGKICLFILENTNFTNNTNRRSRKPILAGCYLCLSHTNCTNTIRMAFVLFASD